MNSIAWIIISLVSYAKLLLTLDETWQEKGCPPEFPNTKCDACPAAQCIMAESNDGIFPAYYHRFEINGDIISPTLCDPTPIPTSNPTKPLATPSPLTDPNCGTEICCWYQGEFRKNYSNWCQAQNENGECLHRNKATHCYSGACTEQPTTAPTNRPTITTINPTQETLSPSYPPTNSPTSYPTQDKLCPESATCEQCERANSSLKCVCVGDDPDLIYDCKYRWIMVDSNNNLLTDVTDNCNDESLKVENCAAHCSNDTSGPYCCNGIKYENKCDAKCNTCFTESDCQRCVTIDCSEEDKCESAELTCSDGIICKINCNAERACSNATIDRSQAIDLTVNCIGENACSDTIIDGSQVTNLEINCNGENACSDATIDGSQTTVLTLNCNGENACSNAIIDGSEAINLDVNCIGEDACDGNTLNCDSGHCLLDCSQETSCMDVTLDGTSCTESCGNANVLINDKQETMHGHSIKDNDGIVKGAMGVGFVTLMIIITLVAIYIRRNRKKKYLSNVKRLTAIMASFNAQKQTDTENAGVETTENNSKIVIK
eukprot:336683_1